MNPLPDQRISPRSAPPSGARRKRLCYERAVELVHENDGRLRDALYDLEQELIGNPWERLYLQTARGYARALCGHVEQCWATAVIQSNERRR